MKTSLLVLCIAALAAAGAAGAQSGQFAPDGATAQQLRMTLLRPGELAGFYSLNCPVATATASTWAQGDRAEIARLDRDGFEVGLQETLHSPELGAMAFERAARFATARGARDAATHATHSRYAVTFAHGRDEVTIHVLLPARPPRGFAARLARAAAEIKRRAG